MRNRKFKVWDEENKKMYYPTEENDFMLVIGDSGYFDVQNHAGFNMKTDKHKDLSVADSLNNKLVLIDFSTMLDRDKKEIYEGDILAINTVGDQDILVVCRFGTVQRRMDTGWMVDITGFYFERSDGLNSFPIVLNHNGKHDLEIMQIVGNIYEHPNMLK